MLGSVDIKEKTREEAIAAAQDVDYFPYTENGAATRAALVDFLAHWGEIGGDLARDIRCGGARDGGTIL